MAAEFDWMEPELPERVLEKGRAARRAMHEDEVRKRAAMLKRLGYPQEHALHRVLGNLDWGFELRGEPPLSRDEVRALVAEVYSR